MLEAEMKDLISIAVLAGGKGRRMGQRDKGLVELNNKPLIEYVIEAIKPQNSNILINANQHLNEYQRYGLPVIADQMQGYQGPLAGVASAMAHVKTPYVLTLPCDAPFVLENYQQRMWSSMQAQQCDLVVAFDGQRLQPVHALIPVAFYADLIAFLRGDTRRVDTWYSRYAIGLADFSDAAYMFHNLNTPEQLEAYSLKQQRIV